MPPRDVTTQPVAGRYELRDLLGRGGMGSVWRGEDLLLQRPVAVKRVELPLNLPPDARDALRQRVLREARAAARVSHPRLVTIFDVVEEEGTVFLVQELVDAPTLKAMVAERGPLPPAEVARIGRQLVDGLASAHRSGVVHRDVKPSNVMVLSDGSVKLADFGIASLHGDPQLTATGVVIGSPAYMAPEQAVGQQVGPPADLWSVGATLYFAVEGEPPFGRADTLSTLTAVVHEPARAMAHAGPMAAVLDGVLVKDPDGRPSAEDLAAALDEVAAPAAGAATEVRAPGRVSNPAVPTAPAARRPQRGPLAAVTALVAIALIGGLALAAVLGGRDGATEAAPPPAAEEAPTRTAPADDAAADDANVGSTGTTAAPPAAAPDATNAVPAGWRTYTDPKTGYTVAHPDGWSVRARDATRTDFTDPDSGTYLRVDWTDEPGPSAQKAWDDQSRAFGAKHRDYREIRIEPTTFQGSTNASLWEYTYTAGGAALHAYNLGFVLGDDYGFALNFQTRQGDWAGSQPLWEQLKAGFRPPR